MNARQRAARRVVEAVCALAVLALPASNAAAAPGVATRGADGAAERKAQLAWRTSVSLRPRLGTGCYTIRYPAVTWRRVACAPASPRASALRRMPRPLRVGGGGSGGTVDYLAVVSGTMSSLTGSFDAVEGVKTLNGGSGSVSDFALQMNTNTFPNTPGCNGANRNSSSCLGWQQFIYSNTGNLYIEYWALFYNQSDCPDHWTHFTQGQNSCVFDSPRVSVPVQPLANLGRLTLTGTATNGGQDTAVLATSPTTLYAVSYYDNVLNLARNWTNAEYNIFGDTSGSQTNFNPGVLLNVRMTVNADAPRSAPTCSAQGYTAETNSLNLDANCVTSNGDAITFTEANTPLIFGLDTTTGAAIGGSNITLTGVGFTGATRVTFTGDGPPVSVPFTPVSDTSMIVRTPPCSPLGCGQGAFGQLITVATPAGVGTAPVGFRYYPYITGVSPASGVAGTRVTVTGNGFYNYTPTQTFTFNGVPAQNVSCSPSRNVSCSMDAPAGVISTADIQETDTTYCVIVTPGCSGPSPVVPQDRFRFEGDPRTGAPTVASVTPNSGSADGGTTVVITGTGFTQAMQAAFGTYYIGITGDCPSTTRCTFTTPRGTGQVHITVGGYAQGSLTSAPTASDLFTYEIVASGRVVPSAGGSDGDTPVTLELHDFVASPASTSVSFGDRLVPAGDVACTPSLLSSSDSNCTLRTPPLAPSASLPDAVPVTVVSAGRTLGVGTFTYHVPTPVSTPTPRGEQCALCREQGGICTEDGGKFVCKCRRSSPTGACE